MSDTGKIIIQPESNDFLTGLKEIPLKSWQKLKLDFWNTIQLFKKDLSKYSDQQLDVLAKYLDIPNYEKLDRSDLESAIARSQADISNTSNLKVKITTDNVVNNIETDIPDSCLKGYEIKNILGSGGYGTVYLGKKLNDDKIYAIKFVNLKPKIDRKNNKYKWDNKYQNNIRKFNDEATLTKLFSDNKIGVKFYGHWVCDSVQIGIMVTEKWDSSIYPLFKKAYIEEINELKLKLQTDKSIKQDEKNKIENRINILQNYIDSLVFHICNLEPHIIKKLRYQIEKIHDLGYIHYDITPANILIKKDSFGNIIDIALTDFGLTRKKTDILNVDPLQHYNFHKSNNPEFYQQVSFDMIQKNPILYDYSFLYYLESCNPGVTPGNYPGITLLFKNKGIPEKPLKLKKKLITPKPVSLVTIPIVKDDSKELQEELNKTFKELESQELLANKEKIIEPIDPTNNDKIIITDVNKQIGQVLGEEILKPSLYELNPDFREYLLLDHLSSFVVDNQVYKSISEYNKKMFDKFTKQQSIGNKTLTQIFNKGLFAAYTQDLTRRKVLLNTLDAQLYYLANDKLIRQTNLENIRKCIRSNLTFSQFFKKIY